MISDRLIFSLIILTVFTFSFSKEKSKKFLDFDQVCSIIQMNYSDIEVIKLIDVLKSNSWLPLENIPHDWIKQRKSNRIVKLVLKYKNKCIKIWSSFYPPNPVFDKAVELNFYDEIGVRVHFFIKKQGHIVGYISDFHNVDHKLISDGHRCVSEKNLKNLNFYDFIKKIGNVSRRTRIHFYDFTLDNIVIDANKNYFLIDLESVVELNEQKIQKIDYKNPHFYRDALLEEIV